MTSDQLAAIDARLRAATPGPFIHSGHGCIRGGPVRHFERGSSQTQVAMTTGQDWMTPEEQLANAEMLAHAPQDIAALIAEVERLNGIYASAVNGRAEMRTALMEERKKRPLGITEWSTVENVERVIAERDAARFCARDIRAQLEAVMMSRDAAIEAFREHGRHGVGCSAEHGAHYRCRCGFDDAREALKGQK